MFYIPLAIFLHHPDISVSYYIWKSMIPAALGNIVGGSVFVAVVYWYDIHFQHSDTSNMLTITLGTSS
jgi:formate/nitrite transporter FocA (FNT family)